MCEHLLAPYLLMKLTTVPYDQHLFFFDKRATSKAIDPVLGFFPLPLRDACSWMRCSG